MIQQLVRFLIKVVHTLHCGLQLSLKLKCGRHVEELLAGGSVTGDQLLKFALQ